MGAPVSTRDWLTTAELREAISTESVLIEFARVVPSAFDAAKKEYHVDADRYVAWIIPPAAEGVVKLIDLGSAEEIDTAIGQIRQRIQADGVKGGTLESEGESVATIAINKELQKLSDVLWRPLAPQIGDAKSIVVCPDSSLWLVPWCALPTGNGEEVLVERFAIQYVVSSREIGSKPTILNPASAPVIFANANFDCGKDEKMSAINQILQRPHESELDPYRGFSANSLLPKVEALPNTGLEASAIAPWLEKMTGKKPLIYQQEFALESVAKELQNPNVVVFATHGFFFPSRKTKTESNPLFAYNDRGSGSVDIEGIPFDNPLLRSGLLLAGCNHPEATVRGDDGVLTAMEIMNIDLRGTELVVLSSCDTGVGDTRIGESVAGVRQAFHLAGAGSVVASLWQVPDRDTLLIMSSFFEKVAVGQPFDAALRESQLNLIKYRRSNFGGAHPLYWAAWTVTN